MNLWFTTSELADLSLNGLPASKIGIHRRIARENWASNSTLARKREGSVGGGGYEYHLKQLPMVARLDYLARQVVIDVKDIAAGRPEIAGEAKPVSATEMTERDARLAIVAVANRFKRDSGFSTAGADDWFCRLLKSGLLTLPEWITEVISSFSARSVARWRAAKGKGEAETLAFDRAQSRKGTSVLDRAHDGEVRSFVLAHLANNPHLAAKHIRLAVLGEYGKSLVVGMGEIVKLPPLRTFQNTLKIWKQTYKHELMYLSDPDGYKSKSRPTLTDTTRADRLNEWWQIDASPLDMMCTDGRVNIYVATDIFSRRSIIHITKTARAVGVGELIRKGINKWGLPENIKTDNGSDFQANATKRLFSSLDIFVDYCAPYTPEQKGVVERHIRTFQHDFAVMFPGFIGHNVAQRKRIEGQRSFADRLGMDDDKIFNVSMTMADVQKRADEWSEGHYGNNKQAKLGTTPNLKALTAEEGVRRLKYPEALDILLAPLVGSDGMRVMTKSGIRADNIQYQISTILPGKKVFCRLDPTDMGRLYVFEPDGETFLGSAINWEIQGLDPIKFAAKLKAERKQLLDQTIADIRPHRRRIKRNLYAIADAMRADDLERTPNVTAFPKAETHIETPQSAAASDAAEPQFAPARPANVVNLADRESDRERFRRALTMRQRIETGEIVKDGDRNWLAGYEAGPEYSSLKQMVEDFGEEAVI